MIFDDKITQWVKENQDLLDSGDETIITEVINRSWGLNIKNQLIFMVCYLTKSKIIAHQNVPGYYSLYLGGAGISFDTAPAKSWEDPLEGIRVYLSLFRVSKEVDDYVLSTVTIVEDLG